MFLVSVYDNDGNQIQLNGGSIAYYTKDKTGKGSLIAFSTAAGGSFITMSVADTPDQITTQINAKLRK